MGNRTADVLHFVPLFLGIITLHFCTGHGDSGIGSSSIKCRKSERLALLEFKLALDDPTGRLSSWVGEDCCKWEGVGCSNPTGHVVELRLRTPPSSDGIFSEKQLHGQISASLLRLKHLTYLDLSINDFHGANIPRFLGSLPRLRYLNLSASNFGGTIPHQLGNLTKLRYLDLSVLQKGHYDSILDYEQDNFTFGYLVVDSPHWLSQLSSLRYMDLSGVNLTAVDAISAISKLSSLLVLRLAGCSFQNIPSSLTHSNLTSLTTLDLSFIEYYWSQPPRPVPRWVFNISRLVCLDLTSSGFHGSLSSFEHLSSLQVLLLKDNYFNDTSPWTFSHICNLQTLDLSGNGIVAEIPKLMEGLSGCTRYSLQTLDLRYNELSGNFPDWIGEFRSLISLHVENNSLSGFVPESLGRLSSLRHLSLDYNRLEGPIPSSLTRLASLQYLSLNNNRLAGPIPGLLGQLSELIVLDISFNLLEGAISEIHFHNLTKLKYLCMSSNSLVMKLAFNWAPPFQLKYIDMRSCVLGPQFPAWLSTQRGSQRIDISNASISDIMPDWFWNLTTEVNYLNLSYNQIRGRFNETLKFGDGSTIDLRSNQFHGSLPSVDHGVSQLLLSDNLFSGDLLPIFNNISDSLPSKIVLSRNLIGGSIPPSICGFSGFLLDLSSNFLSGKLPDCSETMPLFYGLNLANNNLTGDIPQWIGAQTSLQLLHLNNNTLHGEIPYLGNCTELLILDLGNNRLKGKIPAWIGEKLSNLVILRLRSNMLEGIIPSRLSKLIHLQLLDLADNGLSGTIPPSFGNLSSMASISHDIRDFTIFFNHIVTIYRDNFGKGGYDIFENSGYQEELLVAIKGAEYGYGRTLSLVVSLDLSANDLYGEIPEELTNLMGLQSLNLSGNRLTGDIPRKIGNLHMLESLDLSQNQLSGAIPSSISSQTFLSYLNLSSNHLSGRIPSGNQMQVLTDPSIYAGNRDLCGKPLAKKCPGDDTPTTPLQSGDDSKDIDEYERLWLYIGIATGYILGFWTVWGILAFKSSWRVSFFRWVDRIML